MGPNDIYHREECVNGAFVFRCGGVTLATTFCTVGRLPYGHERTTYIQASFGGLGECPGLISITSSSSPLGQGYETRVM